MSAGGRRGEQVMVPRARFSSYYGRPIVKRPVWQERDVAGYLFTGGIAAGSALLAAGADLTGRRALRRNSRWAALAALGVSGAALVHDLGVPSRFHHMLRVAKPTSPMSVGSWLLTAFALPTGLAAAAEAPGLVPRPLRGVVRAVDRPAGLAAAAIAPGIATYTAVLLADTAVPSWHAAYPELPFVFAGSALSGSAGVALMTVPPGESRPARRLAALGAAMELAASYRLEHRLGFVGEPYSLGAAGRKMRLAKLLTAAGVAGAAVSRRSRLGGVVSGAALVAASALTRFAVFEAGVASTEDPAYVVSPQRERLARRTT
jgi:formate-dependent nitrite reductase membrane component NrfD